MVKMTKGGVVYLFVRWNNIYIHDTLGSDHLSMQITVTQNAAKYTRQEVRDAAVARELIRKLGDPTPGDICERLRIGKIKNVTVTPSDVWRSMAIWGKSGASIKRKPPTRHRWSSSRTTGG
jgi:hypothetical protein